MTVLAFIIALYVIVKFKQGPTFIRWIGLLYLVSFLANLIADAFVMTKKTSLINIPSSIYIAVAIICYGRIYEYALPAWKQMVRLSAISIMIFAIINLFFIQKAQFNSYSFTLNASLALVLSVLFFYRLISTLPTLAIHRLPMFWFNTAFLIYSASNIVLFIFRAYLDNDKENWEALTMFWIFHNGLSIVHMLLILVGLYQAHLELKRTSSESVILQ